MPRFVIPTALRRYAQDQASLSVEGTTVGEALTSLAQDYPQLKKQLFDESGKLRGFVRLYLGEEDVRDRQGEATPLGREEEILIVPPIAGGAPQLQALPDLDKQEMARYSRHLILPEVGQEGQRKLKAASVLLIGAGGLGSPLGLYLAAAGVGRLGLVDHDVVDHSNLQRQIMHGTKDVGRPKLQSAKERLHDVNPHVHIETYETEFRASNAREIARDYDIIIDGTDNFPTRYLANDVSVLLGKPNVYGSIFRFEGQASVFHPKAGGPCYRCLYPEPPPPGMVPSCAEGGVLGVLPGLIGTIQATEALKLILGQGESLIGRLLLCDAINMRFRELKLRRDPACPLCGDHPTLRELIDYQQFCGLTPEPEPSAELDISVTQLRAELESGRTLTLLDVREPHEWDIANLEPRGARLIPLGQLPERLAELDREADLVVHCKVGGRSAKACTLLRELGFRRVRNVTGGILAWIDQVDPSLQRY